MKTSILAAAVLVLALPGPALAQTTFRDANGRVTGLASTSPIGTTTFRDPSGHITGSATRDAMGTTTFRDANGHRTSTARGSARQR